MPATKDSVFDRVARGDCTVYASTTGAYCTKAASHNDSDEPAIRLHNFGV